MEFSLTNSESTDMGLCLATVSNPALVRRLLLSSNAFLRIAPSLSAFSLLEHLDLSRNRLVSLSGLPSLPLLHHLNLRGNSLHSLSALPPFPLLQHLDVSDNNLMSLDGVAQFGSSLSTLLVARNDLVSVSEDLARLFHLKQLDLSANSIALLPAHSFPVGLQSLDLGANPLIQGPVQLLGLSGVQLVHLVVADAAETPPEFDFRPLVVSLFPQLKTLDGILVSEQLKESAKALLSLIPDDLAFSPTSDSSEIAAFLAMHCPIPEESPRTPPRGSSPTTRPAPTPEDKRRILRESSARRRQRQRGKEPAEEFPPSPPLQEAAFLLRNPRRSQEPKRPVTLAELPEKPLANHFFWSSPEDRAAVRIQAAWRGSLARGAFRREYAARKLQAVWRGASVRKMGQSSGSKLLEQRVAELEAELKREQERREAHERVIRILWQAVLPKTDLQAQERDPKVWNAVVVLQAAWRGREARKVAEMMKEDRRVFLERVGRSALLIQKVVRGWLVRKKMRV